MVAAYAEAAPELEETPELEEAPDYGRIGRIPVRNLWLLMFYASDLFRAPGARGVRIEDAPDDLPVLIAEILAHAVEERLRRRLNLSYRTRAAPLSRVRGRIDALETECHQLLQRGLVACRFDELTVDTPRNRFVRGALDRISGLVRRSESSDPRRRQERLDLIRRCRRLANDMKSIGVSGAPPTLREMSADRFGHHDTEDRYMVAAARLAFELALPTEESGAHRLPIPHREAVWVRRLFENAVGGFYRVVLSPRGWRVRAGQSLSWQTAGESPRIDRILPGMVTDITLDHPESGRRIVIDTKFNTILTKGWYREQSLRSGYLYQIYAYLRSQEGRPDDPAADAAEGLLLHPSVGESVDEEAVIQGHRIRFATVDLAASTTAIRDELLRAVLSAPAA